MNYIESLDFIHGVGKYAKKLGLANMQEMMSRLKNPQDKLKIVHVAGTNGKGSTTAMIANSLEYAGYRVGRYISPFIKVFNERISINGVDISDDELAEYTTRIKECIYSMIEDGFPHPTEFEIVTAIGFLYFSDKQCDIVILEVGLGGRSDSTNIIKMPILCVICSISFDHEKQLGSTIEKIAFEKCGIIKDSVPVVSYPLQYTEVGQIIVDTCKEKHTQCIIASVPKAILSDERGNSFCLEGYEMPFATSLLGTYQAYNASTAIAALEMLNKLGTKVSEQDIHKGIATAKWMGRFEIVSSNPMVVLDGAHNPSGVQAFCIAYKSVFGNRKMIAVMGMMSDKDVQPCVLKVAKIAHEFIGTTIGVPRSRKGSVLAECASTHCSSTYSYDCANEALEKAMELCAADDVICVVGSLYLIGEVKAREIYNF